LAGGDDDGNLGQEALRLGDVGVVRIVGNFGLPVSEEADGGTEDVHRRDARGDVAESLDDFRRDCGGDAEALAKGGGLRGRGELAVEDQIGDFFVVGVRGEVFDGVAAVGETGFDGADSGFAGDDALEAGGVGFRHVKSTQMEANDE